MLKIPIKNQSGSSVISLAIVIVLVSVIGVGYSVSRYKNKSTDATGANITSKRGCNVPLTSHGVCPGSTVPPYPTDFKNKCYMIIGGTDQWGKDEQDPNKICSVRIKNVNAYKGSVVSSADTNNTQAFDKTITDEYDVFLSRGALIKKTELIIDKDDTKSRGVILDAIKYHTDRNMVRTVEHDSVLLIDASGRLDLKDNGKKVNYLTFIASSEKVEPEAPEKMKDYVITDNKATQYIYNNFRWIK